MNVLKKLFFFEFLFCLRKPVFKNRNENVIVMLYQNEHFPVSRPCKRVTAPLDNFHLTDANATKRPILRENTSRPALFQTFGCVNLCSFGSNINDTLMVFELSTQIRAPCTHYAPDSLIAFKNELPTSTISDKYCLYSKAVKEVGIKGKRYKRYLRKPTQIKKKRSPKLLFQLF